MSTKRIWRSAKDVIDQLEEDGHFDSADIFLDPPSDADHSEEDSADEDAGGTVNTLSGRQLRSAAVATITVNGERCAADKRNDCEHEEANVAESESHTEHDVGPVKKKLRLIRKQRQWVKKDLRTEWPGVELPPKNYTGCTDPVALFECFFDDDVCNFLANMTLKYAQEVKGVHNLKIGMHEVRSFIGILLLSGYVNVPRWRMMWEVDSETFNVAVANAMRRNQFESIKRYFHCSDNSLLDRADKFGKMRPLMAMLNERYLNHAILDEHLCVDESMAPYFGKHGAKQFIRGKPVRFGYKFWCLCDRLGYLIQFEPYQSHQYDRDLGLGASVVLDLIAELPDGIPFKLYGDRFFSSLKLVECLHARGYGYTGTVMSNRMECCPVTASKALVKQPRGSIDYKLDAKSSLIVIAWNDNRPVYVISNVHGVNPIGSCMRWVSAEKKKTSLQVPDAVLKYNMFMGGVDRMDQNIANYRVGVRSKKWWWPVFMFCIETSVHNAWQLYRKTEQGTEQSMDLLEFRRTIVKTYLMKYATDPKAAGRPKNNKPMENRVPTPVRLDHTDHFLAPAVRQNRCAVCRKNTKKMCDKCQVNLHESCFKAFHNN